MREKTYYEEQLGLLADVEGTLEAATAKQQEIDSFLNGRIPKNLRGADRETYDNLVYDLNDILRKRELQQIVDNYDELQVAVTSEEALDEELASIDEIISLRERASQGGNTEKAKDEATEATTAEPGKRYTTPARTETIDLTVEAGQQVINETIERAQATIKINQKGRATYSGSGIAASKQVATLRALLNSGRPLTNIQKTTINGMIRAFEKIIDKEYDIEAQRRDREQDGQEDVEVVEEREIEVIRKDHIRAKIAEQERRLNGESQAEIDYANDVIPILKELEQLQNVPNIDFEAILASEVDKRLEKYRKELEELEARNPGHDFDGMSDEELENRLKEIAEEIQDEWNFRAHQENGMEEHEDDKLQNLLDEQKKIQEELNRRKEQDRGFDGMSDEDLEKRLKEIEEEIQDEYNFRAHQENGMEEHEDDKLQKLLDEQNKIKDELKRRKEQNHELDGMSDEDIAKRLEEIEEEIQDEYNFRAHQENGMEEHGDDKLQKLLDEKKKLQDEQKRRKDNPDKDDDKDVDRKKQRLRNIIKELEGLEREKVKVREVTKKKKKRKTHPKPKPIPEPGRGPKPHDPDPKPKQKLPRHWVEIMADMQTESSGSVSMYFHNMGKIQPLRMGLTIWAAPIKGVMKGVGKLFGDGIAGVNRKKAKMRENLVKLAKENPEEFEILVQGLTETNMRQYKVNEAFLDVVQEVLEAREAPKKQAAIEADNAIKSALATEEQEIDRIKRQLDDPSLMPDRKIALEQQLQTHSVVFNTLMVEHAKQYAIQEDIDRRLQDFERGKQAKSTRKMNIQGWLAGSFNPDNRDVHKQEAEYRKTMREAAEAGDTATVTDMQRKIDELQEANTHEIKLLQGTRFANRARISRGKHKVEEVHQRTSDADQTKGRELIATIMVGASIANLYQRWQANQQLQQQVDNHLAQHNQQVRTTNAHNQQVQTEINQANAHNQGVQQQINSANAHNQGVQQQINSANAHNQTVGQQISTAQRQVSQQQLQDAGVTEIHRNNAASYSIHHEAEFVRDNTPGVGFNHGGSDDAIHAAQPGMTASRTAAESGSMTDVSREVAQSAQRAQQAAQHVLPDVEPFTTYPGKGLFVNSEYVENLRHLAGGGTSSFTLLEKLFKSVQQMEQPELITGQVQDVTGTVQTITGTVQDVAEIPGLVLTMPAGSMVNWLPLVASIINVGHLEQQKAERTAAERARERQERQKVKEDRTQEDSTSQEQDTSATEQSNDERE